MSLLGPNIKRRRQDEGYSQQTLADLANTWPKNIWEYEQNLVEPKESTLQRIAEALNTTPAKLRYEESPDAQGKQEETPQPNEANAAIA